MTRVFNNICLTINNAQCLLNGLNDEDFLHVEK